MCNCHSNPAPPAEHKCKPCVIARHIEGITLNDYEFVLDEQGEVKVFSCKCKALAYLKDNGATDEDIYYLRFFNAEKLLSEDIYEEV